MRTQNISSRLVWGEILGKFRSPWLKRNFILSKKSFIFVFPDPLLGGWKKWNWYLCDSERFGALWQINCVQEKKLGFFLLFEMRLLHAMVYLLLDGQQYVWIEASLDLAKPLKNIYMNVLLLERKGKRCIQGVSEEHIGSCLSLNRHHHRSSPL